MKKMLWILPGVLVLLTCAGLPAQKGERAGVSESPWELRLSVNGTRLRSVLHNRSSAEQTYLFHSKIQPAELILTAPSGERIEPFDTRAEAKFDNTVYREMYRRAARNADVTLTEASVERDLSLRWGPFVFTNLAPGTYRATAVWRSETDQYFEPTTRRTSVLKDVWLGTVTSNTVELSIR